MSSALPDGLARASRKFRDLEEYSPAGDYFLLPFRFQALSATREVLVNEVGDFLLVPRGTAARIVRRQLSYEVDADLYADLLAGFFIADTAEMPLLDVLATRYRTKKAFLDHFTALHLFVVTLRCEHTCHYCQVSRVTADKNAFKLVVK